MFANERQYEILSLLRADGAVSAADLAARFGVSVETVRRDLLQLEKQGHVQRVHGGAVLPGKLVPISRLDQRVEENRSGKLELSETAAQLVDNGDVIYIDSGATAHYFAGVLKKRLRKLTVITHSQDVFDILHDCDGFELILCGGHYMKEERVFYGYLAQESLKQLYADKAFLFASAVSIQGGVCDFSQELVGLQKQIMSQCGQVYLLADSQKFERRGLYRLCGADSFRGIVTDTGLSLPLRKLYTEKGINIIIGE
ncbi:MAG: DeoR/GlpR transcriptional regulator [Oscillospiraceae bacterium]|nr:DeoR/GlpR transcriptional regulator [Oscillospiraceae bacterium]